MSLLEWYDSETAPHEALGRAARQLRNGGALYLGGGVGVEAQQTEKGATTYALTGAGKTAAVSGPLTAVIHAFAAAGASSSPDTPGGAVKVTDPAVAARLRELSGEEASAKRDIERWERRAARRAAQPYSPTMASDDGWEQRRVEELRASLVSIAAERRKLLAVGKMEEVEQARPGTNFTKVPAANVAKLRPIIDHYKGMAHPFATCVRDQVKHGLSEDHANRRCAVVKDLGQGTTKWRKGSKVAEDALTLALARLAVVEEQCGAGGSVWLAECSERSSDAQVVALGEQVAVDLALLAIAEHPLGLLVFPPVEEFSTPKVTEVKRAGGRKGFGGFEALHPRDPHGQFTEKIGALKAGEKVSLGGVQVTQSGARGFRVSNVRGDLGKREDAFASSAKNAAHLAVGRSLASKDPASLGGAKSYSSIMDLPGNEGMAPKMAVPNASRMPGGVPAGAVVRGRQVVAPGDADYERLNKIVGPPEPGSPAAKAMAASHASDLDAANRNATRVRLNPKSTMHERRAATARVDAAIAADKASRARPGTASGSRTRVLGGAEGAARAAEVDEITTKRAAFTRTPEAAMTARRERLAAARSSGEAERIRKFASNESFAADVSAEHQRKWAVLAREAEAKAKALRAQEGSAREGERGEGVGLLVEAFSQSAPVMTPPKRDALGKVGPAGRKKLAASRGSGSGQYDETKHKRASAGAPGGGRFVSKGSSGEDVRAVQREVGASPDGKFGSKTKQAVMDFQRKHGLVVDGVVGRQTALAMRGHFETARKTAPGALHKVDSDALKRMRRGKRGRSGKRAASRGRGGEIV